MERPKRTTNLMFKLIIVFLIMSPTGPQQRAMQSTEDYATHDKCILAAADMMHKRISKGKPVPMWMCVAKGIDA